MEALIAIAFIALLLYWGLCDYESGYPPPPRVTPKEEEEE